MGEFNIKYTRPPITSYQRKLLDSPARYTVCEAATKCGKTASHIIWLFEQALQCKDGQSVWWIAPVYAQAEIAFNRMKKQVTAKDFFVSNSTKLTLTLPNGAKIEFKSAEKPDNLYGDDVYAAVFDEFTRAREEAWFALRSTLTATRAKCKFIGNAKGKKNWGYRLGVKARSGEADYEYHKITAWDAVEAGILEREEVENAQRDLPEHIFKELYLAEPSDDASNPFGLSYIQSCISPLSNAAPVAFGVDLAKSVDWTVIVGLDENGRICYYDRFQSDWLQTKQRIIRTIGRTPAVIDATGNGDPIVEDIQRECPNVQGFKFTSDSKQSLMEDLASAIQSQQITILDGVMREELEAFEFTYSSEGRRVRYSAPVGLHDDTVCALALANRCKRVNKKGVFYWA